MLGPTSAPVDPLAGPLAHAASATSSDPSGGLSLKRRLLVVGGSALLWTALGLALSVPLYFALSPQNATWQTVIVRTLPVWWSWGLLSPAIGRVERLLASQDLRTRILAYVPLSILFTLAFAGLRAVINWVLGRPLPAPSLTWLASEGAWYMPMYWLLAAFHAARLYRADAHERAERNARLQASLGEARLAMLRAQLNPHFLFNTLNSISAFVERDVTLARGLIADLGELLRIVLDRGEVAEVTLAEEMSFVRRYLTIQQVRHGPRLRVDLQVPADLLAALVPTFLVQPLVENAIIHGIGRQATGGTVALRVCREGNTLLLQVDDDGPGLEPKPVDAASGMGLRNTAERLRQQYGPGGAALTLGHRPGGGARVEVRLPLSFAPGAPPA